MAGHVDEQDSVIAEIDLMRQLKHPNVVQYLGVSVDVENCIVNIFQEWMPLGSVETLIKRYGPLPMGTVRTYVRQVVEGLVYLHEKNIIHRDIKGANILVDEGGCVKLADFGASAQIAQNDKTQITNQIMGTLMFMAPEVLGANKYGRKADVWAVGCTVIQMATGEPPWKSAHEFHGVQAFAQLAVLLAGLEGLPPYNRPSDEPADFRGFLELCLAKKEGDRPSSAELLNNDFLRDTMEDSNASFADNEFDDNSEPGLRRGRSGDSMGSTGSLERSGNDSTMAGIKADISKAAASYANNPWKNDAFVMGEMDTFREIDARLKQNQNKNGDKGKVRLGQGNPNARPLPLPADSINGSINSGIGLEINKPSRANPFAKPKTKGPKAQPSSSQQSHKGTSSTRYSSLSQSHSQMSHLSREHELPRSRFEPVVVEPLDGNESNEADVSKELLVMPSLDSETGAMTGLSMPGIDSESGYGAHDRHHQHPSHSLSYTNTSGGASGSTSTDTRGTGDVSPLVCDNDPYNYNDDDDNGPGDDGGDDYDYVDVGVEPLPLPQWKCLKTTCGNMNDESETYCLRCATKRKPFAATFATS